MVNHRTTVIVQSILHTDAARRETVDPDQELDGSTNQGGNDQSATGRWDHE